LKKKEQRKERKEDLYRIKKLARKDIVIQTERRIKRRGILTVIATACIESSHPERVPSSGVERRRVLIGISFFLLIILMSCDSKTFDNEKELWTYLKDEKNGYIQHKNVNGYDFTLLYKPTDLLVKQELGDSKDAKTNSALVKKLRTKYKQFMYLTLSMSKNNQEILSTAPKNRNEFGAMVNQLAFGMSEKVHLYTQEKDTIALLDFVYPRMYGMSRSTDILFVYLRDEEHLASEYINFTIEDLGIYTGEIKFKIPPKNIKNEPKLDL